MTAHLTCISQYAINKSKILFGYVGNNWEQHIVAELDSALNRWVDSVPDHCTFFFLARIVIYRCIYSRLFFLLLLLSVSCFQCDGTLLEKMTTHSTNRRLVTHSIIIFKFLYTVHSSRPPTNLSLLWLFAQTLRDRVAILLRFSERELLSLHYIPMSVKSSITVQLDDDDVY